MRKKLILITLLSMILTLTLGACSSKKVSEIKALYLTSLNGGQLSEEELKKHPEVVVVNDFEELKNFEVEKAAIWIDKNSVNLLEENWLNEEPQKYYPLVMVGYNNALYSFREMLNISTIQGPKVDWSKLNLEPGFSIWMIKEEISTSKSAFMKGYEKAPSVEEILEITNMLLEGKFPENDVTAFSADDAIAMVKSEREDLDCYPIHHQGKINGTIYGGGKAPGIEVPGEFETKVESDEEEKIFIVTFTEYWNYNDFHYGGDGNEGDVLSHYWKFRVSQDKVEFLESNGNFPPQLVK